MCLSFLGVISLLQQFLMAQWQKSDHYYHSFLTESSTGFAAWTGAGNRTHGRIVSTKEVSFCSIWKHKQKSQAASSRTAAIPGLRRALYGVLHTCLQRLLSKRLRTRVLPSSRRRLHRALRVQPLGRPADLRYRGVVNSVLPRLGKTETSARNKSQTCVGLLFSLSSVRDSDPFLYEPQKWSKYGFFISLIYLLTSSF